jgi:nucleoid-associated protein YgaU
MPSRYSNTKIKRDKSGIRAYKTTYYPDIPIRNEDQFIYPRFGERLDTLAYKFYGNSTLWWVIAKANGIRGKLNVPQDTEIRIPGNLSQVLEDFDNLNK